MHKTSAAQPAGVIEISEVKRKVIDPVVFELVAVIIPGDREPVNGLPGNAGLEVFGPS
jgi:hypothetical protein